MHNLLARWHAADVADLLARRVEQPDSSIIGTYDRRRSSMDVESQTDFLRRALGFGVQLRERTRPGDPVIVACSTPAATFTAYLGAIAAGTHPVIHAMRPAFEDAATSSAGLSRLSKVLGGSRLIVTSGGIDPKRLPLGADVIELDMANCELATCTDVVRPAGPSSIAHLQSTSGTTGSGKIAVITHENIFANVDSLLTRLAYTQDDRVLTWLPLYHDMGLVLAGLISILSGTDVHLMAPFDFLADPAAWMRTIGELRITCTSSPNFAFEHVLRRVDPQQLDGLDLAAWRHIVCGAEPVDARTLARFHDQYQGFGLDVHAIKPSYGLAETTLMVSMPEPNRRPKALVVVASDLTRIGTIELRRAVDLDDFDPVDLGPDETAVVALGIVGAPTAIVLRNDQDEIITEDLVCGEIIVTGPSATPGYRAPDGSIEPHPMDGVHTGDIGFVHEGQLFVVERTKNIIIRNGENHSATVMEIELGHVLDRHLSDVVVLDSDLRPGCGRVVAIVGVERDEAHGPLLDAMTAVLDRFDPALEQLVLVPRGAINRTTSGKKQHAKMRAALQDGSMTVLAKFDLIPVVEDHANVVIDVDRVDRRNRIRSLVEQHAKRRGYQGDVRDDSRLIHDLGFDSLAIYELVVGIESETHTDIPEELLSRMKRVDDLLDIVEEARTKPDAIGVLRTIRELPDSIPQRLRVASRQRGRQVEIDGRWVTDLASCNYLGLDLHPALAQSIAPMVAAWGVHPSWTRAVASPAPYVELERKLAALVGANDVVVFPTVTLAHIGVLPALSGPNGAILIDRAAHNSMQEAADLAGERGATVTRFAHNDLTALEAALIGVQSATRRVIVVDGVYSMSGGTPPLPALVALAERYDAVVYVDDAHGFGMIGEHPTGSSPWGRRGNGVVRFFGLDYERIVYVGGLSKAYSSMAAFVTTNSMASRRSLESVSTAIFSGPIPVASLATSLAALAVNDEEGDHLRDHVRLLTARLIAGARELGFEVDNPLGFPIVTLVVGDLPAVERSCKILWTHGILLTPSVFPAAPLDRGGVRFTLTSANTAAEVEATLTALADVRAALQFAPSDVTVSSASRP